MRLATGKNFKIKSVNSKTGKIESLRFEIPAKLPGAQICESIRARYPGRFAEKTGNLLIPLGFSRREAVEIPDEIHYPEMDRIFFGGEDDPAKWAPFSNSYACKILWHDHEWPHSEGPFQWAKMMRRPADPHLADRHLVDCMERPQRAKRAGRRCIIRGDWEQPLRQRKQDKKGNILPGEFVELALHKVEVMYSVCRAKFGQNAELSALLLSTGDKPLHENRLDSHWGGGPSFPRARDLLGQVLMRVRDELCEPVKGKRGKSK